MSRLHLSPHIYSGLQNFVHRGHRPTFDLLTRLLEISPGETVVEIGCGTGILAHHFVSHGYDYWGIDFDPERIDVARQQTPGAHFQTCDALAIEQAGLPNFKRAFIHGVLHHLNDAETQKIISHVLSLRRDMTLVIIEPFRRPRWWNNPFGALIARLDEGRYVRTLEEWRDLFEPKLELLTTRNLWPRWPQDFLDARLRASWETLALRNAV
ncbi:MAG: class I SAM-dependent methyltransferase [Candidatus Binatia bacterium]